MSIQLLVGQIKYPYRAFLYELFRGRDERLHEGTRVLVYHLDTVAVENTDLSRVNPVDQHAAVIDIKYFCS